METYTEIREPVDNPQFGRQKQQALRELATAPIDEPIAGLIEDFNKLPYCYTLQCCYGHFVYPGQDNPHKIEPLPLKANIAEVEYRIAYIAFCIDNIGHGRRFLESLQEIVMVDPGNIQLGCADWFWDRQVNSYALQVEPDRFKKQDTAIIGYQEALRVEAIRNEFYSRLGILIDRLMKEL
jgi:hypothetical protein